MVILKGDLKILFFILTGPVPRSRFQNPIAFFSTTSGRGSADSWRFLHVIFHVLLQKLIAKLVFLAETGSCKGCLQ